MTYDLLKFRGYTAGLTSPLGFLLLHALGAIHASAHLVVAAGGLIRHREHDGALLAPRYVEGLQLRGRGMKLDEFRENEQVGNHLNGNDDSSSLC